MYPSRIDLLSRVIAKHPDVQVLSKKTSFRRDYSHDPYAGFEKHDRLFFSVKVEDNALHKKAWYLLIDTPKGDLIVPLATLWPRKKSVRIEVDGRRLTLRYDIENRLIDCPQPPRGVTYVTGFYFALRTFYPEAELYEWAWTPGFSLVLLDETPRPGIRNRTQLRDFAFDFENISHTKPLSRKDTSSDAKKTELKLGILAP